MNFIVLCVAVPHTWQQLNDNVEKFYEIENLEMVFAVTVMTTNLFDLPQRMGMV